MLKPNYWDREIESFEREDFYAMEDVIIGWRGEGDCPFRLLDDGKDVAAQRVAKYAREVAEMLEPHSSLIEERPKLLKLAAFAERMAEIERAKAAVAKAARACVKAGFRFADADRLFVEDPAWDEHWKVR